MPLIEQILNGLLVGSYYTLLALGLSIIFSLGGVVNLAHGAFYAFGAYLTVVITERVGFSTAFVLTPVAVGIFGVIIETLFVRKLYPKDPILTLLFRNYFTSVPEELFKAARVDGAGFWGIYFKIMLPMSLPIFVVAIILQVTGIWNDFLFGVIYTKPDNYPMTVQLNNIVNSVQGIKENNVNMAATILTGLVPLIVYFVSGKLFVRGIAAGAVKG